MAWHGMYDVVSLIHYTTPPHSLYSTVLIVSTFHNEPLPHSLFPCITLSSSPLSLTFLAFLTIGIEYLKQCQWLDCMMKKMSLVPTRQGTISNGTTLTHSLFRSFIYVSSSFFSSPLFCLFVSLFFIPFSTYLFTSLLLICCFSLLHNYLVLS